MKPQNCFILLFILVLCPIHSAIADKLYQVEILVFEQADKHALGNEWWPENPGSPNKFPTNVVLFSANAPMRL